VATVSGLGSARRAHEATRRAHPRASYGCRVAK
jgi:hypothetical protein